MSLGKLNWIDYSILCLFIGYMVLVGFLLKKKMKGSGDFLLAGRKIPGWVTGIAFISANISALELIGMSASGAEYGFLTFHFYYLGAIPGMIFLGIFMMPFYYSTKIRSVPEYLKYRFDNKAHLFNSLTTLLGMALGSGIYLYSMSLIFEVMLGWDQLFSIFFTAIIVLIYTFYGGLISSIYTEVLQFFLTILGLFPLLYLGLMNTGGWEGLMAKVPESHKHMWIGLPGGENALGWDVVSVVFGLGFVLSFSYWTCGFTEVQRAMAAKDYHAARMTPLIGAMFKILLPFLTIIPGLIALAEHSDIMGKEYNKALLIMIREFYPNGMLGLGITALVAAFMAGMSSSITALNTIFTYDIYQTYIRPGRDDNEYLKVGKICTAASVTLAVAGSFIAMRFDNVANYIQLLFSFFNAPLIGIFLLGMFWKRASTISGFYGLLLGTSAGLGHYLLVESNILYYKTEMVSNFYGAIYSGFTCIIVIFLVSLVSAPKPIIELEGLLYSTRDKSLPFWDKKLLIWGSVLIVLLVLFNLWLA
ncbi:sodium:solute symporter family protein [Leptospira sp. GIMC2001]|uniref:sodium:solute symporter family protein n=1 Tax=Leptospira sp. GIMC2001 TaxID=1513297 RepID=UPI00234B0D3E|nr:sodium:solute symporter family protein [Leptospira sp. GIMC2001]WCL48691.1 sodium:solute symporter family protein [Leptospira sp. GIMC2001]